MLHKTLTSTTRNHLYKMHNRKLLKCWLDIGYKQRWFRSWDIQNNLWKVSLLACVRMSKTAWLHLNVKTQISCALFHFWFTIICTLFKVFTSDGRFKTFIWFQISYVCLMNTKIAVNFFIYFSSAVNTMKGLVKSHHFITHVTPKIWIKFQILCHYSHLIPGSHND